MDVADITAQLSQLDGDIDKMEGAVKSLITDLSEIAATLPLLDKAKLYVLAAYTIETALFNALRLQGIDAKKQPIFTELTRVKQYFAKIKLAEEPPAERTNSLNTQAAIRFIKADLADNPDINTKLKEQLAKERAKAAVKAAREARSKKRSADQIDGTNAPSPVTGGSERLDGSEEEGEVQEAPETKKSKRSKGDRPKKAPKGGRSGKKSKSVKE